MDAPQTQERCALWETFTTLNKVSAPQLERHVRAAGLKIVRDYRTSSDFPIPESLLDVFNRDVLTTEQIVWMLQHV